MVKPKFGCKNLVNLRENSYICKNITYSNVIFMIVQFSVGNYLSFKELSTLSLVSTTLREPTIVDDDSMIEVGGAVPAVLHGAAIYGANASGKSNFIKAFSTFKWLVINSMKELQAGETLDVESFMLNATTAREPSVFEIVFCNADHIFRYGFETDSKKVYKEWLYRRNNKKRAKEVELLFREGETYNVHPSCTIAKNLIANKMVRNNALLVSAAAQFNDETAASIVNWLSDTSVITNHDDEMMWKKAVIKLDDSKIRKRIVEFSKYADLGIEDIYKVNDEVVSSHVQYDDNGKEIQTVSFPFASNESEGTIKYFQLAYPIIDALDNGKRLVIDEIDSKMHPKLTSKIIELFNSKETNPNHAQLIFTIHDTNILSAKILRRDQVWFTQKDNYGATQLYSLAEYKVRNNASFEKDYLEGKYGGTPIIGDFEKLFTNKEE